MNDQKQFEALKTFAATGIAIPSFPEGASAGEKFIILCQALISDAAGVWTPPTGTLENRKASALYQTAIALSATPASGPDIMLNSAKAIYDSYTSGSAPTKGATKTWRTIEYLLHSALA